MHKPGFALHLFITYCVPVYTYMHSYHGACVEVRSKLLEISSPSFVWGLKIKLRLLGLAASTITH